MSAPAPTLQDLELGRAALDFAAADKAVREHDGPKSGPEIEAKIAAWREAYAELIRIAGEHPGAAA